MVSQEVFAKREKNGAKKNTHLVCKGAEGTKYDAAINWKIPVVSYEWLLKCLEYKTWVSEEPFWVGNASVSTPGKLLKAQLFIYYLMFMCYVLFVIYYLLCILNSVCMFLKTSFSTLWVDPA